MTTRGRPAMTRYPGGEHPARGPSDATPSGTSARPDDLPPIVPATRTPPTTPEGERVEDPLDLDRYTRLVRRHIRPALVVGLLGLLGGVLLNVLTPGMYRATTHVHAPATPTKVVPDVRLDQSKSWRPKQRTQDTDAALLLSGKVLRPVSRKLGVPVDELRERHLSLSVPPNTRVLRISFTAGDPDAAREGAQTVAEEFVRVRDALLDRRAERVASALWRERERAQGRLEKARKGTARYAAVNQQIRLTDKLLAELAAPHGTRIVQDAVRPTAPLRHNQEVPPISGAAIGVLGGLGLGVVRERRRRVVFDRKDVFNATGRRTVDLANIAVELQVTLAQRVLVTGAATREAIELVAGAIRARLDQVGALTCQVVPAFSPVSGNTIRAAMTADLVIVVAERGYSTLVELRRIMHLLDRSQAEVVVFLARGGPS